MKAISLWQPWASAMALGYKRYETRSWPAPRGIIGQLVAIHAAKRWTSEERRYLAEFRERRMVFPDPLPLGVVVAVGTLVQCRSTTDVWRTFDVFCADDDDREYHLGNYAPGRFAWEFASIARLPHPVPCRGMQGVFDLDDATCKSVMAELEVRL